jgi:Mg2+ and Co2+ transporter CorA
LQVFRKRVNELDDQIETATTAAQLYSALRIATPLARAARYQHRALQEAREAIDNRDLIVLRDIAGDVERTVELLTGDAKNALDYIEAKEAEAQTALAHRATEAQHRLNMVAALFLPITAVGSVLGMNLHHGFENSGPAAFWIVCAAAFATGFVVRALVTRGERSGS